MPVRRMGQDSRCERSRMTHGFDELATWRLRQRVTAKPRFGFAGHQMMLTEAAGIVKLRPR